MTPIHDLRLHSLGLQSDLWLLDAEIIEREHYSVVRSRAEPDYYYGNFLLFKAPPQKGCIENWQKSFVREFTESPKVRHQTFLWDTSEDNCPAPLEFAERNFVCESSVVLQASQVGTPRFPNPAIEFQIAQSDNDWGAIFQGQLACNMEGITKQSYANYLKKRLDFLRRKTLTGKGAWFSAFIGGVLAGNLGIFVGDGWARFQQVVTHPQFRRQGVCQALVAHASKWALDQEGVTSLLMVADEHYHAARIYESLGFRKSEHLYSACLYPKEK